jgi:hypothetical protein
MVFETIFLFLFFFLLFIVRGGVHLGPLSTAAIIRPTVPASGDYDDGEIGEIIGRGNQSTRRKPVPVPLCPPQTPHATRTRTRAAAIGTSKPYCWMLKFGNGYLHVVFKYLGNIISN